MLERHVHEGDRVKITLPPGGVVTLHVKVRNGQFRLGLDAPREVKIEHASAASFVEAHNQADRLPG